MFNRSQIMTRAWEIYRAPANQFSWGRKYGFAECLCRAWGEAKRAAMSMEEIRVNSIRHELATLSTRSFQQNIEPLRRVLEAELFALAA